jgi:hypothetical protein
MLLQTPGKLEFSLYMVAGIAIFTDIRFADDISSGFGLDLSRLGIRLRSLKSEVGSASTRTHF